MKKKNTLVLGRMHMVPLSMGEVYYLRVLLGKVRGQELDLSRSPTLAHLSFTFDALRAVCTANATVTLYDTYKGACLARGYLADDLEWCEAMTSAIAICTSGYQVRETFVTILCFNSLANAQVLFDTYWEDMGDDLLRANDKLVRGSNEHRVAVMFHVDEQCAALGIALDTRQLEFTIAERTLARNVVRSTINVQMPRAVRDERSYDIPTEKSVWDRAFASSIGNQRALLTRIRTAIDTKTGGLYFVDALGGTGTCSRVNVYDRSYTIIWYCDLSIDRWSFIVNHVS